MPPAWERHDFAAYARRLVRVQRLERAWRVLLICAFAIVLMPLVFTLLGSPLPGTSPLAALLVVGVASFFKSRARRVQVRAIATWVSAGDRNTVRQEPSI